MVSVLRPDQRILHIPGIGVQTSRRAVASGAPAVDWSQWFTYFWQFKGAASQAASYVDILASLTMTTATAPTWSAGTGLAFNGSTQYMDIGFVPAAYMTVMLQFTDAATGTGGETSMIGHYKGSGARFQLGKTGGANSVVYGYGGTLDVSPAMAAGNVAIAGIDFSSIAYRNGIAEPGSPGDFALTASQTLLLGARRREDSSSIDLYTAFTAAALGINTATLNATQIAAAKAAMAAL